MDPRPLNVLLVSADAQDEADIRQKLAGARNTLFAARAVSSLAQAFKLISDKPFDTFLIDLAVPDSGGISGLQCLAASLPNAPLNQEIVAKLGVEKLWRDWRSASESAALDLTGVSHGKQRTSQTFMLRR